MLTLFLSSLLFTNVVTMPPEIRIFDANDILVERLAKCESSMRVFALNKKEWHGESAGLLQFRRETFREQMIKYGFTDTTEWDEADWENALWDATIQRKLAKLMISDGLGHRWGCWNKIIR